MLKISQKDLLTDGFLDNIKQLAKKTVSGVAGAALGAAKSVGKDLLTMNTGANLFASAASGAKSGFKQGLEFVKDSPEGFVENILRTEWSGVFDYKSIKVTKKEDAAEAANKSFKLSKVNRFFVNFNANRYKDVGGVESGEYKATINRKPDGKFVLEEITDSSNNRVSNYGSKQTMPTFVNLFKNIPQFKPNEPHSAEEWAKALKAGFRSGSINYYLKGIIELAVPAATGKPTHQLTAPEVEALRQALVNSYLISEKITQLDTLNSFNIFFK